MTIAGPAIPELLGRALTELRDERLVVDGGSGYTYAEVAALAARLQQRLVAGGVAPGSVVSLQLPNWVETVAACFAVWGLGAVPNPIPMILRERDLAVVLALADPSALLVAEGYGDGQYERRATSAVNDAGLTCPVVEVPRGETLESSAPLVLEQVAVDDIALLMFTSGTTGRPKGVLHSHRTLIYEARSIADVFGLHRDSVVFMPSPLGHITGLLYGVLLPVLIRSSVVLLDRWDPGRGLELIESHRCAFSVAATPFLDGLLGAYRERGQSSAMHTFVCGGADIPIHLVTEAESAMGTQVFRTYGLTEMPTLCVGVPQDPPHTRHATEGKVIGDARARLGEKVGGSDAGELEIVGPELFLGYLDPADNESAFTPDGWFRTGDLATISSAGEITIKGRIKDLIVRGGENISAKEVEDLILAMPEVDDVALVAVPDRSLGERAAAVVVGTTGEVSLPEIAAHLRTAGIAHQKFPEIVLNVRSLPRTASGKIQKFLVRDQVLAAMAAGDVENRNADLPS